VYSATRSQAFACVEVLNPGFLQAHRPATIVSVCAYPGFTQSGYSVSGSAVTQKRIVFRDIFVDAVAKTMFALVDNDNSK
jgi:hypothetical protein